ncbi:MAG: UDP-galactose-lipid carrier transferase [Planctomycetota bacterium]|nr:MAG: UDP-galactose-lipid carrier transferase [Planctomycetota bacterium]
MDLASKPALGEPPHLEHVDLDSRLKKKAYRQQLKHAQHELFLAHQRLYGCQVPVVVVFEGWDAAGKGGVIKRINEHLDPRGFHVSSTAAPTAEELAHHYLRRFWLRLPQRGHIGVFDRSWYGRVLVERVEGFARSDEWQRAYQEITDFEEILCNDGYLIRKYFLHIDSETQLARFQARKLNPLKRWKLTDEDWRNRERWSDYEMASNDMFARTHSVHAPWMVVPAACKRWARVAVVRDLAQVMHQRADDLGVEPLGDGLHE